MARQRNRGTAAEPSKGERVRRRLSASPELELSEEELRALADEGIDPEDVRRIATERRALNETSEHDRDTARDDLEGLVEDSDDY